jgi:hypothetical protein
LLETSTTQANVSVKGTALLVRVVEGLPEKMTSLASQQFDDANFRLKAISRFQISLVPASWRLERSVLVYLVRARLASVFILCRDE